ncbi:MAG: type II 3-dehydroquinate dehydratase [Dehalococcoidia bacterium]|nr:type II 3-dehydroquinate dehydratase [Dehalococcoidia bacterium]MQG15574.1 type II 3-dehydroquinate dehydratase [SAR202 cluster bacterium]
MMKLLVINGPNLNMLGKRDADQYGTETLDQISHRMSAKAAELDVNLEFFQSNHEGDIIDFIQANYENVSGILINPGALTHYGISLRDCLSDVKTPFIEIHLSDIHEREEFRRHSLISDLSFEQIKGHRGDGYIMALERLVSHLRKQL